MRTAAGAKGQYRSAAEEGGDGARADGQEHVREANECRLDKCDGSEDAAAMFSGELRGVHTLGSFAA